MDYKGEIIEILNKYNLEYVTIDDNDSLLKIYNLFCKNIIYEPVTSCEIFYLGTYYENIMENYIEMEKYYLIAIKNNISVAMNNLGNYHYRITKNYIEMEKYYLVAIDKGFVYAMFNLALYHDNITKNYFEMEKYYLMAIDKGDNDAMNNFAFYHRIITKNYVEMEKYYLMAIDKGNNDAMNDFANYHKIITKNYVEMEKYYLMAIANGSNTAINYLVNCYKDNKLYINLLNLYINNPKLVEREIIIQQFNDLSSTPLNSTDKEIFLQLLTNFEFTNEDKLCVLLELLVNTLKNNISLMDLHFTYTENGKGFEDAKKDYFDRCLGS